MNELIRRTKSSYSLDELSKANGRIKRTIPSKESINKKQCGISMIIHDRFRCGYRDFISF